MRSVRKRYITATMLYNLSICPHRLALDLFEDPAKRMPESAFLKLLWEKGTLFEEEVVRKLELPVADIAGQSPAERERLTAEAMESGVPLIHGGRIRAGDLLGEPDLLRRAADGYIAGDIKSGSAEESPGEASEGRPKVHYAVQLALYTDILERVGKSPMEKLPGGTAPRRMPFVWDVHGQEVAYDLGEKPKKGNKTLWEIYEDCLGRAVRIAAREESTTPALTSACKICHWRRLCLEHLKTLDDLTLIPELGRKKRDAMLPYVKTVSELAAADVERFMTGGGKTVIPGVGPDTLRRYRERARLKKNPNAGPYARVPLDLPGSAVRSGAEDVRAQGASAAGGVEHRCLRELFFDIETDPMRDFCYLHGFLERSGTSRCVERYVPFVAEKPDPAEERRAFAEALSFVRGSSPCAVYYYSHYERTWWRKLQARYPDVASQEDVEALFGDPRTVDLYTDVVKRSTEWPTMDYSIKTLAKYLGFHWRDASPSGAESVEWYNRWVETGDSAHRDRILRYNEDDCRAMVVLLDVLRTLKVRPTGSMPGTV
jgi:predicted RecB family nuclease